MELTEINASANKIEYLPKRDNVIQIDRYLFEKMYEPILSSDPAFLIYKNGVMWGYCQKLSFAYDILKADMSMKTDKSKNYKIVQKKVDENTFKLYFYEVNPGWIYNGHSLLDKYMITVLKKMNIKNL